MKKLTEVRARSAIADRPVGKVMTLDDLGTDPRSQVVTDSFERVLPQTPLPPASPVPQITSERAITTPITISKASPTQMLSTPIDAQMKKKLNQLRLEHGISTAFIVELALTRFFGTRRNDEIAQELLQQGGRLRRTRR